MSTSFSPAPQPEPQPQPEIQPFLYVQAAECGPGKEGRGAGVGDGGADPDSHEQAAREAGRQEGEAQARAVFEKHLAEVRASVQAALNDFARERASYYEQVEAEVVQLALSLARKVLHRETQVDPLLLAGIVRVALEKIERGTKVVVRVHPQQVSECRQYFALHMAPDDVPEVVEDATLESDRCVLQTALGTTELGIEVQLKEIEQGLMDLLAQRPRART